MDKTLAERLEERAAVMAKILDHETAALLREAARAVRESGALADTQRAIIEAAERRGYVRAVREAGSAWTNC